MVRHFLGVLKGNEIRSLKNTFRNQGLLRPIRQSVLRGDSLQDINKIMKKSGVDLNLSQVKSYISGSYALSTFENYFARAQAKHNIRNGLGLGQLVRDGYRGIARVTVKGYDNKGKQIYRNLDVMTGDYDNLTKLLDDIYGDLDDRLFDSLDITREYEIVSVKFV